MIDIKKLVKLASENIEQVLTDLHLPYVKEGEYIACPCPFHGGEDYNLKFKGDFFYCFSQCQRGYSILNVIQKVLDVEFQEAVEWLCNELGISEYDIKANETAMAVRSKLNALKTMKSKRSKVNIVPVDESVMSTVEQCYPKYLLDLGYSKDAIKHFSIGYARYGVLASRVVFPIDYKDGTIIALSGRLPNAKELGLPKYKILEGTKKSYTLYNISRINPDDRYIIVVEGFKSVMSLYDWGFKSVVAVMGSSLSHEQRTLLLGLGRKIICLGDNDEAGQRLNQQIYNQCSMFADVVKVNLGDFTDVAKASPCEEDLGFECMSELVDRLEELVNE